MLKENYIEESLPHDSAKKHVSGYANYTDDIKEPETTLYAAVGFSKKAHAIIKKIDLKKVEKSEGVIAVITHRDIPEGGINDVGPVYLGDPIFPTKKVLYVGQPLFAVAATTTELARKAVLNAKITYKILKPIVKIKDALKKKSFVLKSQTIKRGDPSKIDNNKNCLKGEFTTSAQEHSALEGQIAFAIPQEDNNFLVYSSTQNPSETQHILARMLNQKNNSITVSVRRIGGGFGGKETTFIFSAIATLLARKTKRPVKFRCPREDDFIITGKRHDFWNQHEVYYDNFGLIEVVKIKLASRCGFSPDLSSAVNIRALTHLDGCYFIPNLIVENHLCKTNTSSSTAFRGFGGQAGAMVIENILDNVSRSLKKDPAEVRRRNFYLKDKKNITHYGMKVHDNVIQEIFDKLLKDSNYKTRRKEIEKFNLKNKFLKKGIYAMPLKFGISFTTTFLNQAGALVHIYHDGSVEVTTGAIEMGNGTYTKIGQIVSKELGLPFSKIKVSTTATNKVPNTSASAASATTDLNGAAALNAITNIKKNLYNFVKSKYKVKDEFAIYKNGKVKFKGKSFSFKSLVKEAYLNRVKLFSSGFYKTPKIYFDKKKFKGRPYLYFTYGASVSEVIIDTLTGENKVLNVQILHDAGRAINPAIELGQIYGGFVQGMGWHTMEKINWNSKGELLTKNWSTYKIPTVTDMPNNFDVKFFKNLNKENVVNKSKTTGEPPLLQAASVFFAIKDAVHSINNYDPDHIPVLDSPATNEEILMSIKKLGKINL
mgnify:CR=1 FL=1|tara:strand:+ start:2242 stop:4548 length:2307 start_codon:yes stop_codon:yes gene_type:complete